MLVTLFGIVINPPMSLRKKASFSILNSPSEKFMNVLNHLSPLNAHAEIAVTLNVLPLYSFFGSFFGLSVAGIVREARVVDEWVGPTTAAVRSS
ncbi:hypothetical protein Barb6_03243 [Bacteroidales bacterium Barb6]|nr:hypothetical protein Barb6_03243 [Bacteroidales bacterium Barb6]